MHTLMKKYRYGIAIVVAAIGSAALSPPAAAAYTLTKINPKDTDSQIANEVDSDKYHWMYAPSSPVGRLALFIPGTFGHGVDYEKVAQELANAGMHVIMLKYKNSVGTHGLCDGERLTDPNCFRKYRHEVTFGSGVPDPDNVTPADSSKVSVNKWNSVMNRTLKLVEYLKTNYASQGWGQFQSATNNGTYGAKNLTWATVTAGGHSQGSGVALYLGKFYAFEGVAMQSGPQDGWDESGTIYPPNWISEGGFDVNLSAVFGFDHETEESNMTAQQTANWSALGLPGSIEDTDALSPPYNNSNRLQTSAAFASGCFITRYHNSTSTDTCTPGTPPTHKPVWLHIWGN